MDKRDNLIDRLHEGLEAIQYSGFSVMDKIEGPSQSVVNLDTPDVTWALLQFERDTRWLLHLVYETVNLHVDARRDAERYAKQ